ncbi:hypothetical protein GGS21DRAFT_549140 [Xylaria nigripes]|nr:hypothetical protein GGS21DRAFT_549140 [Xylaria nigripes]
MEEPDTTDNDATNITSGTQQPELNVAKSLLDTFELYPVQGYVRDSTLLRWASSLPQSSVSKVYSWSNEAVTFFILALCEAKRAGLITPSRMELSRGQGRIPIWNFIRQRFCESGLYALVPGLTNGVCEAKYKSEVDSVFKPYKRLMEAEYSGTKGFSMDPNTGQFTASEEQWKRHFSIKANARDKWLQTRGMPMWAQYEEAFGEDIATGEVAMGIRQEQKILATKWVRPNTHLNTSLGPQHDPVSTRAEGLRITQGLGTTTTTIPTNFEAGPSRVAKRRSSTPGTSDGGSGHSAKRTRGNEESGSSSMSTFAQATQEHANRMEQIAKDFSQALNANLNRGSRAYAEVQRLGLGKNVEAAVLKALDNDILVGLVLNMVENGEEERLRQWCLEQI